MSVPLPRVLASILGVSSGGPLDKEKCEGAGESVVGGRIIKNCKGKRPSIQKPRRALIFGSASTILAAVPDPFEKRQVRRSCVRAIPRSRSDPGPMF